MQTFQEISCQVFPSKFYKHLSLLPCLHSPHPPDLITTTMHDKQQPMYHKLPLVQYPSPLVLQFS